MDQFAENAILIPLAFIRFFVIIEVSTRGRFPGRMDQHDTERSKKPIRSGKTHTSAAEPMDRRPLEGAI